MIGLSFYTITIYSKDNSAEKARKLIYELEKNFKEQQKTQDYLDALADNSKMDGFSTIRRQDVAVIASIMQDLSKRETVTAEEKNNVTKEALEFSAITINKLMEERKLIAAGLAARHEEEKKAKLLERRNSY